MKSYEDRVTVACVNFAPVTGDKAANLEKIKQFTIQASNKGANIIVFPETALTGYLFPVEMMPSLAETIPGQSTEEVAKLAAQHDVYVIFGMVERDKKDSGVFYNSAAVVGPTGVLGAYQKVHLGRPREVKRYYRGNAYPLFETIYGPIGVDICKDFCFPEVARIYAIRGVRLLIHPTAFPEFADVESKDYRDFYKTMLGARSIENKMFIASANLVGTEGPLTFIGYSAILGPKLGCMNYHIWAGPAGTEEEIIIATLDLASLAKLPVAINYNIVDRYPETYFHLVSGAMPNHTKSQSLKRL